MSYRQFDSATHRTDVITAANDVDASGVEAMHVTGPASLRTIGASLLQLQRGYGNRYVQHVVEQGAAAAPVIQTKLVVRPADDKYEREADHVARQVAGGAASESVMRAPDIQRLAGAAGSTVDAGVQQAIQAARGGGQPLPDGVRGSMEQALGTDFRGVRVHADAQADQLNRTLQARAFATGQDLFFRRGEYSPSSSGGRQVLAHELTHVVQQGGVCTSAAAPAGTAALVQRELAFRPDDIPQSLRTQSALAAQFGKTTKFTRIVQELDAYWAERKISRRVKRLKRLRVLIAEWQNDLLPGEVSTKQQVVVDLLQAVQAELPAAQALHTQMQQGQEGQYLWDWLNDERRAEKFWAANTSLPHLAEVGTAIAQGEPNERLQGVTQQAIDFAHTYGLTPAQVAAIKLYVHEFDYKYIRAASADNRAELKSQMDRGYITPKNIQTRWKARTKQEQSNFEEAKAELLPELYAQGQAHHKFMKRGLKRLPNWHGRLYRGEAISRRHLDDYKQLQKTGRPLLRPEVLSWSKNREMAKAFAKTRRTGNLISVLFTADITAGKDIAPLNQSEQEVITQPGTLFVVEDVRETTGADPNEIAEITVQEKPHSRILDM